MEAREAVRLDPGAPENHAMLGWALNGKGDYAGALPESREAMRINPNIAWVHNNAAWTLDFLTKPDEAIAEARRPFAWSPTTQISTCLWRTHSSAKVTTKAVSWSVTRRYE